MNRIAIRSRALAALLSSFALTSMLGSMLAGCDEEMQDEALCDVPRDYGALGNVSASAGTVPYGPYISMTIDSTIVEGIALHDQLEILLHPGVGVFAGGLKTGSFTIGGDEAVRATCGLCLRINANLTPDLANVLGPVKFFKNYQAISGTVTLTSATRPFTGTVRNLSFVQVSVGGSPITGGCKTEIASASFTSD